jgi:hypothetical protein
MTSWLRLPGALCFAGILAGFALAAPGFIYPDCRLTDGDCRASYCCPIPVDGHPNEPNYCYITTPAQSKACVKNFENHKQDCVSDSTVLFQCAGTEYVWFLGDPWCDPINNPNPPVIVGPNFCQIPTCKNVP